jgi:hypothetical protein
MDSTRERTRGKKNKNILLLHLTIQKNENSRSSASDTPRILSKIAIVAETEGLHLTALFLFYQKIPPTSLFFLFILF